MKYSSPLLQTPLPALTRRLPGSFLGIRRVGTDGLVLSWLSDVMVVPQPVMDALKELTDTDTVGQAFQQVRGPDFYTFDVAGAVCLALFVRYCRLLPTMPEVLK